MNLLMQYRAYFAKIEALKISVAVLLSIIFTLLLGFHDATDYAWFAPFSVIVSLIEVPLENQRLNIIYQRTLGMLFGSILALIGAILFKPHPLYLLAYAIFFTLVFTYFIGKNHKYSYFWTLGFIYLDLLVCFIYVKPTHFYAVILHFPFMIIIALVALLLSELLTPINLLKKKIPHMSQKSFNLVRAQLGDIAHLNMNSQWFLYLEKILIQNKSGLGQTTFNKLFYNIQQLNIISSKLNYIASHLSQCEDITHIFLPEIKNITRLIDAMLANLAQENPIHIVHLKDFLETLSTRFHNSEFSQDMHFKIVLHEFGFILNALECINHPPDTIKLAKIKPTKQFNWDAVWFALKITLSIAIADYIIEYFNMPGDYQAFITATVIAAIPHSGTLLYKFTLRMGGILLAGLLGLGLGFLLMPIDSILITTLTVVSIAYLITWWTIKYDRKSYAGIQCGLVFILLLLANGNAHYGINMDFYKFEAVMAASFIALFINLIIAPELPSYKIDKRIKKTINDIQSY